MTVRTCVMAACMIVVPGLALCSHHLPAEVRAAARCDVWQPLASRVQAWFASDAASAPPAEAAAPAEPPLAATVGMPLAPAQSPDPIAPQQRSTEERLAALGAAAVECRPLESGGGVHVASCRVALDAAGQLHRVFQAAGPSPAAAVAALAEQVEAWQARWAARAQDVTTAPVGR
ncbi:MAG: hypothetical protein ACKOCX_02135 [Planctomycetota bacterium]